MSAPIIWIGVPLIFSILLFFISSRRFIVAGVASGFNLLLVIFGLVLPIDEGIKLGTSTFEISSQLIIVGRKFIITGSDAPLLIFINIFAAFWFFGAAIVHAHRLFIPLGQCIIAFAIGAIFVEPFLYSALLIEIAVLISIPMLIPPDRRVGKGALRYLIFQTLAMPLVLYAGWVSAGVEANPANQLLLQQGVILLGLGFAFWLAVFPFYSWVPLLVGESQPYVAGFLLSLLQTVVLVLMLNFLNTYAWLRDFTILPQVLRLTGTIMVASGGIIAAFQKDLARLFGYTVIMESGFSLLALSLISQDGVGLFIGFFVPRVMSLALWSLALSNIGEGDQFRYENLRGLIRRMPLTCAAIIASIFSLAGLPIFASFPIRQALFADLSQISLVSVLWAIIGCFGLLIGGCHAIIVMCQSEESWNFTEKIPISIMMVIGILGLTLIGTIPYWVVPYFLKILNSFENLSTFIFTSFI